MICHIFLCILTLGTTVAEYSPVLSWDVCSPSRIVVTLTGGADGGIIYIRGYGSACKQDTFSVATTHEFDFNACGIDKAETYFTIIVQKSPLYQTGGDLQESLICIYDLSDISVGNGLNVGDKDDDAGINKTVKPTATMKLYKDGVDIGGNDVKLTDLVTMSIQVDNEYLEDFDIKAKSCRANFIDITHDFCAVDTDLFPNFVHVTQGVVTSTFGAFRTTDLGGGYVQMIFTCTIQVCRGLCTQEQCGDEPGWGRRKRAASEDVAFEDLNVGTSMSVGTDIDLTPTDKDADDSVCIANLALIIGLLAISLVLFTSMSLTTISTRKLMKRTEQLRKMSNGNEADRQSCGAKLRMEIKQPVSLINATTEVPTVITSQNDNCNSTAKCSSSKSCERTCSKSDMLKTQSSNSVKASSHGVHYGGSASQSAAKSEHYPSMKFPKTFNNFSAANQNLEADLDRLKQCRDMLKIMGINEIIRKK